jgi:hypothetical protein
MTSHVLVDRLQFTLTVTFHYIFPILTMGLALFVAWLKTVSYLGREDHRFPLWRKTQEERDDYESAARFWAKIFAISFAFGVVTGIPLEFQFGTNWAQFSNYAGGVIGTTLALEGVFAFFAESVFLGIFLAGREPEQRPGGRPRRERPDHELRVSRRACGGSPVPRFRRSRGTCDRRRAEHPAGPSCTRPNPLREGAGLGG